MVIEKIKQHAWQVSYFSSYADAYDAALQHYSYSYKVNRKEETSQQQK